MIHNSIILLNRMSVLYYFTSRSN